MKVVRTYIILWYDDKNELCTDYIQALSGDDAINILGVDMERVLEVSVVLKKYSSGKDWERVGNHDN